VAVTVTVDLCGKDQYHLYILIALPSPLTSSVTFM
jgi:hypothetical protein